MLRNEIVGRDRDIFPDEDNDKYKTAEYEMVHQPEKYMVDLLKHLDKNDQGVVSF